MLLLEAAFFYLVAAEGFQGVGLGVQGEEGEGVDEPFCGVVLVPDYCVACFPIESCQSLLLLQQNTTFDGNRDDGMGMMDGGETYGNH